MIFTWKSTFLNWLSENGQIETPQGPKYLWVRQCFIYSPGFLGWLTGRQWIRLCFYLRDEKPGADWVILDKKKLPLSSSSDEKSGWSNYTFRLKTRWSLERNLDKLRDFVKAMMTKSST
jgi:hypothetical protein